ncbi:hypothetical protein OTU49_004525, partial [Cherax quadricarinatus]
QMGSQQVVQGSGDNWVNIQHTLPMQPQQPLTVPEIEFPGCFTFGIDQDPSLMDMLDIAGGQLDFNHELICTSDIKADYGGKKTSDSKKKQQDKRLSSGQDVEELGKMMSEVRIEETSSRTSRNPTSQSETDQQSTPAVDVAFRVAVSAAECLQAYAATGDIALLLASHRYLLAVQNNQGDTALHTAVSNKNMEAFNKILKASEKINPRDLLNAQNFANETALHQAVRGNEVTMVRRLVAVLGCDVSIVDSQGNTPIHCAAELQDHRCLEALLTRPINGTRSALTQAVNAYNYQGATPLHIAVSAGNLNCVRLLISAGGQVHYCERKRGANPLHLAVMFSHHEIAHFLLNSTSVTVEAGMFDGNTALHLAAQARDQEMCKILLRANADPQAKNALSRGKKSAESEEEEETESYKKEEEEEESEEECDGYTPVDYAGENEQILAILRGEEVVEENVEAGVEEVFIGKKEAPLHSALDSGIDISITDIQGPDSTSDGEESGELSERMRGRLASHLSGDTWRHLAQLLDLDYMVPCWAKESSPAELLLHPDNMKTVTLEKLRECLEVLGLKECVAVLDQA